METARETPKSTGYSMPAEWENHSATWVTFPHNWNTWPERLENVQKLYAEMLANISTGERVELFVQDAKIKELAKKLISSHKFANMENVIFHELETQDSWIRDYGPTFVVNREKKSLAIVAWIFNAWGMKYEHEEPLSADKKIPAEVNKLIKIKEFLPGIIMEGGSLEVNGTGTVLTTEQCLLNKNRNPQLSRAKIEHYLCSYLSVRKIVWLGEGVEGDDTDGHIDDIARFVDANTVLCCVPDKSDKGNYELMLENKTRLENVGLRVIALPMPAPIYVDGGKRRLPASYANFYIANSCVIVPVYNDKNDKKALDIIAKAFPTRKIVPLFSTEVVYGFGSWHCLTQQQPAV